jgi:hypothetical protein
MKAMLSSGRVEPIVRPPIRETICYRHPHLKGTAQGGDGRPPWSFKGRGSAERVGSQAWQKAHEQRESYKRMALTKRSVSNARINPPPDKSDSLRCTNKG